MTFSECVEQMWSMRGGLEENAIKLQNETGFDKYKLLNPEPYLTDGERLRFALVWSTPKVVWDEYLANGYTLLEAIDSEFGYL